MCSGNCTTKNAPSNLPLPPPKGEYVNWVTRFIRFYKMRHPKEMGVREVEQFLTYLAVERRVSASTQNQALNALIFLYKQVPGIEIQGMNAQRAKTPLLNLPEFLEE